MPQRGAQFQEVTIVGDRPNSQRHLLLTGSRITPLTNPLRLLSSRNYMGNERFFDIRQRPSFTTAVHDDDKSRMPVLLSLLFNHPGLRCEMARVPAFVRVGFCTTK